MSGKLSPKRSHRDLQKLGEGYKVELLEEIPDEDVSLYEEGGFVDLCRGPHIESTGR